jgi:hypothetical protein
MVLTSSGMEEDDFLFFFDCAWVSNAALALFDASIAKETAALDELLLNLFCMYLSNILQYLRAYSSGIKALHVAISILGSLARCIKAFVACQPP